MRSEGRSSRVGDWNREVKGSLPSAVDARREVKVCRGVDGEVTVRGVRNGITSNPFVPRRSVGHWTARSESHPLPLSVSCPYFILFQLETNPTTGLLTVCFAHLNISTRLVFCTVLTGRAYSVKEYLFVVASL